MTRNIEKKAYGLIEKSLFFLILFTGVSRGFLVARIGNDFDLGLSGFVGCAVEEDAAKGTYIELDIRVEHNRVGGGKRSSKRVFVPCFRDSATEFAGLDLLSFGEPGLVFRIFSNKRLVGPEAKESESTRGWSMVYQMPFEFSSELLQWETLRC